MHILAGDLKGTGLFFPKSRLFRPTQSKVKESLFNILAPYCFESTVLDLCCGTGALGLEALSRGASHCTFVDIDTQYIKKNIERLGNNLSEKTIKIVQQSVPQFLKRLTSKADIIIIDPPWDNDLLYERSLNAIHSFDILSESGILVVECNRKSKILERIEWKDPSIYTYGDTQLLVFKL
jgi:16S rRNA (guanine966-N2)-methyltransferase